MSIFAKLASVLLATADELDRKPAVVEVATTKEAAVETPKPSEKLATLYKERTGLDLEDDVRESLNDARVAEVVEKLAGSGAPRPLGEASDRPMQGAPATREERAKAAWDNFGSFLINRGQE